MFLALFVESLGNVLAMAVQKRQGVPHISSFAGNRYRETLLFVMAAQVMLTGMCMYTFANRNMGWLGCGYDGALCECAFVGSRGGKHTVLSAFCCTERGLW
mmetsp:Transcript_96738/g.276221  ORF Transcript_96738/g.276221 Transcript_96738/m.276221 type:complete len:101 (-) Transcript_96738:81-383(-)